MSCVGLPPVERWLMQKCWEEPYQILDIDSGVRRALASGYRNSEDATWYACPLVLWY